MGGARLLSASADAVKTMLGKNIAQAVADMVEIRRDVHSTAIEMISYTPGSGLMRIRFRNKRGYPTYDYPNVDIDDVARFIVSPSKGKHYHHYIKNRYGYGG